MFCNTQDVDLSELQTGGSTTSTNTNGVVRNVLMCAEAKPAGPREGLLVFGKDFMSNKIKEGGAFYLKAQRVAKFCAPRALGGGGPLVVVCDKVGVQGAHGVGAWSCSPNAGHAYLGSKHCYTGPLIDSCLLSPGLPRV